MSSSSKPSFQWWWYISNVHTCVRVCVIHQSVNDHNQKFGSMYGGSGGGDGGGGMCELFTLSVIVCIRFTHVASSCTCRLFPFRSKPNYQFASNLWLFLFRIQTNSTVSHAQPSQNRRKRDGMIVAKKISYKKVCFICEGDLT